MDIANKIISIAADKKYIPKKDSYSIDEITEAIRKMTIWSEPMEIGGQIVEKMMADDEIELSLRGLKNNFFMIADGVDDEKLE